MTDVQRVIVGRAIRGFADGFVSVLLARYLLDLGFSPFQVGAVVTGTLLGSAALTLAFGFRARRTTLGRLLVLACFLMAATGLGFARGHRLRSGPARRRRRHAQPVGRRRQRLPPLRAGVHRRPRRRRRPHPHVRHLQPVRRRRRRPRRAGLGAPRRVGRPHRVGSLLDLERVGLRALRARRRGHLRSLPPIPGHAKPPARPARRLLRATTGPTDPPAPTAGSSSNWRALFSLDSAGSGFVVTSLLVLWLHLRFDLSREQTAGVFFAAGLLGAASQLLAPVLARRIGLIRTMVFTHLPANVLLALAAFAPNGTVAVALLLLRALFAQMDVPARQAFVMAVVPPRERALASSITNVPAEPGVGHHPAARRRAAQPHRRSAGRCSSPAPSRSTYDLTAPGPAPQHARGRPDDHRHAGHRIRRRSGVTRRRPATGRRCLRTTRRVQPLRLRLRRHEPDCGRAPPAWPPARPS